MASFSSVLDRDREEIQIQLQSSGWIDIVHSVCFTSLPRTQNPFFAVIINRKEQQTLTCVSLHCILIPHSSLIASSISISLGE